MEIKVYASGPDQEFSLKGDPARNRTACEQWGADPVWGEKYNELEPSSSLNARAEETGLSKPLKAYVRMRRDSPEYGFIYNLQNGLVFYADREAFELVLRYLDKILAYMKREQPWLLQALRINPAH